MTTTKVETIQEVLEKADPNTLADALRRMGFGKMLNPIKIVCTGLTAAASFDITTAAVKAAATVTGLGLEAGENLPPIGDVVSLRVTASGTANSVGTYAITDSGTLTPTAGANVGLATLSADGKTLTFPSTVTAFVLTYQARASVAITESFEI
jgi:hypothetical protein